MRVRLDGQGLLRGLAPVADGVAEPPVSAQRIDIEEITSPSLVSLAENIALSTVVLRSFRAPPGSITPMPLKTRVADLVRLAMLDAHGRRVFRASRRGERRGIEQVAQMKRSAKS